MHARRERAKQNNARETETEPHIEPLFPVSLRTPHLSTVTDEELKPANCCKLCAAPIYRGWMRGGTGLRHTVTAYSSEVVKQVIKHEEASATPPTQTFSNSQSPFARAQEVNKQRINLEPTAGSNPTERVFFFSSRSSRLLFSNAILIST